jgi:ATP-dependent Lon protease
VGAAPGRVLAALREAGVRNPVLLLDEIDKMGAEHGDPGAALLEVLDPEQHHAFRDHYLEVPFDLSEVVFVATANSTAALDRPLRDRLEVLTLEGYDAAEKLEIARRHLLPRLVAETGLPPGVLTISDGALARIIDEYTAEAGVRGLERALATICRKVARQVVADPRVRVRIRRDGLGRWLGRPRNPHPALPDGGAVGVTVGLAWTESGGAVLPVEVGILPGSGTLRLTGNLGEVLRESAQAALTHVRAAAEAYGLPEDFFGRSELHVHLPEGAIPKDGPSAGLALACAMVSAAGGRAARPGVAVTGEITVQGRVLPVGGIRAKVMAARRAGMRRIVLPQDNLPDWEDLSPALRGDVEPVFVRSVEAALAAVLGEGRRIRAASPQ